MFGEHVHSRLDACFAVACLMTGLSGMAYYSAPEVIVEDLEAEREASEDQDDAGGDYQSLNDAPSNVVHAEQNEVLETPTDEEAVAGDEAVLVERAPSDVLELRSYVLVLGMKWSRRTLGILSAIFSGIYGGSIMVPMKWAPDDAKGTGYLISFAIGAASVTLSLWIIRGLYLSQKEGSLSAGFAALPSMHLRKMWPYGAACGLLWSIGNFFSILSVEFLGEGVGYSVVQSSILGTYKR